MNKFHRFLISALMVVCLLMSGCGADNSVDNTTITPSGGGGSEGVAEEEQEEGVQDAILGEWKLVDLVQISGGKEHIIAKTLSSKKSGSADYFAFSSWFIIKVYDENYLECSSSSVIIKPYINEYGNVGSWEKLDDGSYKIYADGLLNSGVIPKPKDGFMLGEIIDGFLICEGESDNGDSFIATLRYAGEI